jgi:GxxExxY protein
MREIEFSRIAPDSAMKVHRALGPGLPESVYEAVLTHEMECRGPHVLRQAPIPIAYEGRHLVEGFRADLIVEGKFIVELESIERVARVHEKQVLTYLRLSVKPLPFEAGSCTVDPSWHPRRG